MERLMQSALVLGIDGFLYPLSCHLGPRLVAALVVQLLFELLESTGILLGKV